LEGPPHLGASNVPQALPTVQLAPSRTDVGLLRPEGIKPVSVYVDALRPCRRTRWWPWPASCHLLADDLEELHAFAHKLGLKREWFQKRSTPHYDLAPRRRALAIRLGAIEIDRAQVVTIAQAWRERETPQLSLF
jgi:hypothetical protein